MTLQLTPITFLLVLLGLLNAPTLAQQTTSETNPKLDALLKAWDASTPAYNSFREGQIKPCPKCSSWLVVVSEKPPSKKLLDIFKKLAKEAGYHHEGVVIDHFNALKNVAMFHELKCRIQTRNDRNYVLFVFPEENVCARAMLTDEKALFAAIATVYTDLTDTQAISKGLREIERERKIDTFLDFIVSIFKKFEIEGDFGFDLKKVLSGKLKFKYRGSGSGKK